MATIICTSCQHPNADTNQVCDLCQAPLMMTRLAATALSSANQLPTLLPIGGSPTPQQNSVNGLVPVNALTQDEDYTRAIQLPQSSFEKMMGWTDFASGHFPQIDLAKLFPELITDYNGNKMCQVSRKTATIRRDQDGFVFLECDFEASSLMWVQVPGEQPYRVLPGDIAFLQPGMFVFLGKNNAGVTFIVR